MCASPSWKLLAIVPLLCALGAPEAQARWRADWELTYQLLFSDNVARVPFNEREDYIHIPRVGLFLAEDTGRFTGTVNLQAERRFYQDSTFDDEDRNYLDVDLVWGLVENRLNWVFQDDLREEPISVRVNDRPDNLQQVNVFTTGPDLIFQLGRANNASLQARFVDTYAEEQKQFDAQRLELGLLVQRNLSEVTDIGIGVAVSDVDFENNVSGVGFGVAGGDFDLDTDDLSADYKRQSIYGVWNHQRQRDQFDLQLGVVEIEFDNFNGFDLDDELIQLGWTRTDNRYSFRVGLFSGINSLARFIGGTPLGQGSEVVNGQVAERDSIDFTYTYQPNIGTWEFNASYADENFVGDDVFDRKRFDFGGRYSRPLSPRSTGEIYARRSEVEFQALDLRQDERTEIGIEYIHEWSAHWYGGVTLRYIDQNSDILQFDYDEMAAGFRITYRRNPPQARTAP